LERFFTSVVGFMVTSLLWMCKACSYSR